MFQTEGPLTMNARILFTATLAVALASSLAQAGEARPLSRADVVADYQKAKADGTLQVHDYDIDFAARDAGVQSSRTRQDVVAEMARARPDPLLVGFTAKSRTYNPYGSELLRMKTVPRAEVKAQVLTAMRDGTLRHSDYDDVPVRAIRRRVDPAAAPILAGVTDRAAIAR
jgi:uncharacterized membrane protein